MRHIDLDAPPLARKIIEINRAGDEIPAALTMFASIIGTICGLGALFSGYIFGVLLFIPLTVLILGANAYQQHTYKAGRYDTIPDEQLEKAEKFYFELRKDPVTDSVARPLIESIIEHVQNDHEGSFSTACGYCRERVELMRQLRPKKIGRNDVEEARLFLETRKEFM